MLRAELLVKNIQLQLQPLMKTMFQNGVVMMSEEYVFLEVLNGEI
jgi:hypothetical protein